MEPQLPSKPTQDTEPDVPILYRFGVQLYLLRQNGDEIEVYLQQRHSDLRSFPNLWTSIGGVIDGFQNLTEIELSEISHRISSHLSSTSTQDILTLVNSLLADFFQDREIKYFCEIENRSRNASKEKKREILTELVTGVAREIQLGSFNPNDIDSSSILHLAAIFTAKNELQEETGVDISSIDPSKLIFNRMTESSSGSSHYRFPIFLLKANGFPEPRFDHDAAARAESGLPPRLEAQADGWFSLSNAIQMGEALTTQTQKTIQLLESVCDISQTSDLDKVLKLSTHSEEE